MYLAAFERLRVEMMNQRNYTISTHMHGPTGPDTIRQVSGNAARSLVSQVEDHGTTLEGVVGFPEGSVAPYVRIIALGGTTRAHVIEAQNAKALAFMAGGQMIFRRKVNHPGSKFIPRPFLQNALAERSEQIKAGMKAAMLEAIK
jgi:hypothetical protein